VKTMVIAIIWRRKGISARDISQEGFCLLRTDITDKKVYGKILGSDQGKRGEKLERLKRLQCFRWHGEREEERETSFKRGLISEIVE